jgi:hypothetical protein
MWLPVTTMVMPSSSSAARAVAGAAARPSATADRVRARKETPESAAVRIGWEGMSRLLELN